MSGELHLILGCMYSGKTTELLKRYDRYQLGNKKCLLIKYKKDTRYDKQYVVTHNGIKANASICENLYELDHLIPEYDIICIDEIQFYKDAYIFCEKWSSFDNKVVHACGLNGTFARKPFKNISDLIPLTNSIKFEQAVCKETGKDGLYSHRLSNQKEEVIIGGSELYIAADRETYFKGRKIECFKNLFKQFTELFPIKKNKLMDNNCLDKHIVFIDQTKN